MIKPPEITNGPWEWSDTYQTRDLSDTWSLVGSQGFGILSCDGICNSPQNLNPFDAKAIEVLPELLEAACVVVNHYEIAVSLKHIENFQLSSIYKLKQALLKAGCVDE